MATAGRKAVGTVVNWACAGELGAAFADNGLVGLTYTDVMQLGFSLRYRSGQIGPIRHRSQN